MDVFLLVVVIILALVLIGMNIFLLTYYIHTEDTGFGQQCWPKIVVVIYKI